MAENKFSIRFEEYSSIEELAEVDKRLVLESIAATDLSYAPYSSFHVGAAVLLANGKIVKAGNQENAAFPMCSCAEKNAVLDADVTNSGSFPVAIAISAKKDGELVDAPVTPCGSCRQVLSEQERRYKHPIRVIMNGQSKIYVVETVSLLMPFTFSDF